MGANSSEEPMLNKCQASASLSTKKSTCNVATAVPSSTPLSSLKNFTWERFNKSPDIYRKRVKSIINTQLRQIDGNFTYQFSFGATVGLLRYATPELNQLKRDLGLLHIKCRTLYERFVFSRCLREKQKDYTKSKEELASVNEHRVRCERELERKKTQLDKYKKICAMKNEFLGLNDENKLKKIESVLGMKAPPLPNKDDTLSIRRSFSDGSLGSVSSDDSSWDEQWLGTQFAALSNQELKPA
ncbi:hypothetical protein NECAME_04506 [Necator americanus]|uniref:Uncharacterized protein n=1 Tax=Necator americanus TaxID=51031 RepID=W2SU30_NECAM|nr:hypothetical protein NECAME_04506 [Necator americanus]ETN72326.1 hypothetical protein NECAME_04506 [Necator americanus]